ncbi:hypothetical protein [Acidianus brierleyi]|uniref:Uncharacterized protein n=1 Tax=Acidianus brierleyi TaxID=41673 RepID=A0A2U9IFR2_9CREN|nr:hypothetical protein [Acidianus brierleyi]AWR94795.1 hypothetical protein DFR85_09465 [Acidianus brierleyi]
MKRWLTLKAFIIGKFVFLERLLDLKSIIISYYYSINLTIIMNVASLLSKQSKDVCIINYDKIKWDFYPYNIDFSLNCSPKSEIIVFEAENEREIPKNFRLVTTYKNLKIDGTKIKIDKVDINLYKSRIDDEEYLFRVINGKIEDYEIRDIDKEILNIITSLGNPCNLTDVINISQKKLNLPRDKIREELQFLIQIGKIKIHNKIIELI